MSVLITTSLGDLVFDLYTDKCPLACQNFLKLCKIKYYHGSRFHYVKKNFIAVAGDRSGIGEDGDSIYKFLIGEHYRFFDNEIHPCLNHSKAGTIGMLSGGENLNASRFYITLVDNILSLDGKYTVFGEVSEGFDTLAKIADTCVDAENIALENIRIRHTDLLEDPFPDPPELAELIPDASPEGKPKEEVSVNGRREYDLVMTDEELSPQSQKEVIYREAGGYSSVLESIRKPPDNSLFIWNLNPVTEGDGLDEIFSRFGTVSMAQVFRDFESHDSLGCAIICFECEEACKKACLKMNNASLDGRIIRIDFTHNYHWKKGLGPYDARIKRVEEEIEVLAKSIDNLCGTREIESETGLAPRSQWDLVSDEQMIKRAQPLLVGRCTKVMNQNTDDAKYVIDLKKRAKFVVGLGDKVSPTDIEEGMRVGVDSKTYQIQISLPPKVDLSVVMMIVEEKPDVTYNDVGGCKEQIEKIREIVELPMLHPEKFVTFGIDPPKGALCYGPPGTGKTLVARAVANRTNACFIRVIGSELVQKNVGEGARIVRELFQIARSKKACIVFFDEVDAIGGARFEEGTIGNDNEAHRTLLEIANQLDGFDARGNIKVLMATNRPDTLDPALVRHGRLDRNVEFCLPDREGRTQIFKIHTRTMKCERDIRFELLALLCPNSTGADIKSVCIEAGLHAIGAKRKSVSETDFMAAVHKVIKGPKYKSPYI